jgi:hypothetical protein
MLGRGYIGIHQHPPILASDGTDGLRDRAVGQVPLFGGQQKPGRAAGACPGQHVGGTTRARTGVKGGLAGPDVTLGIHRHK